MPYKEESYLNEEYTKTVKEIYNLIKEAKGKYDSLPDIVKEVKPHEDATWPTCNGYILNAKNAVYSLAKKFGINPEG